MLYYIILWREIYEFLRKFRHFEQKQSVLDHGKTSIKSIQILGNCETSHWNHVSIILKIVYTCSDTIKELSNSLIFKNNPFFLKKWEIFCMICLYINIIENGEKNCMKGSISSIPIIHLSLFIIWFWWNFSWNAIIKVIPQLAPLLFIHKLDVKSCSLLSKYSTTINDYEIHK